VLLHRPRMTGSNRAPRSTARRERDSLHEPPRHRGGSCHGHEGPDSADLRLEIGHSCAKAFRHHIRRFFGCVSPDRRQAMTGKGHEDAFPRPRPSARCRFSQETFARGNGQDAPKPAVRLSWVKRVKTHPIETFMFPAGRPGSSHSRQTFGHAGGPAHVSSSSSAFASLRSGVPKPSVNQP